MRFEEGFSKVDDSLDVTMAEQLVEALTERRTKRRIRALQGPGDRLALG
jgi:hypothetical protein